MICCDMYGKPHREGKIKPDMSKSEDKNTSESFRFSLLWTYVVKGVVGACSPCAVQQRDNID